MSAYTNLSKKEIDQYLTDLELETRTANSQRMNEINQEVREINQAVLAGDYDHTRDSEYRSVRDTNTGAYRQQGGFNPMSTYGVPQGQLKVMGSYEVARRDPTSEQDQEYRKAFFDYARGLESPEKRAMITTTDAGAVIPTTTFDQIMENIQKATGLVSQIRLLSVPGKMVINQSDLNSAAIWHTEGDEILDSNLPPKHVELGSFELAKLFSMSVSTQAMAIAAFEAYFTTELSRCTQMALSSAIVSGSGLGQPTGILNGVTWTPENSISNAAIGVDELLGALAIMPPNFQQNAVWAMNTTELYAGVASIKDSMGRPLIAIDLRTGLPSTLLGKPIVPDDFLPAKTIVLCDPKYYFLNFSSPISILRSIEAGFTKGSIIYRSLCSCDGKVVAPEAFVRITHTA